MERASLWAELGGQIDRGQNLRGVLRQVPEQRAHVLGGGAQDEPELRLLGSGPPPKA
jgi:hypothetical protein